MLTFLTLGVACCSQGKRSLVSPHRKDFALAISTSTFNTHLTPAEQAMFRFKLDRSLFGIIKSTLSDPSVVEALASVSDLSVFDSETNLIVDFMKVKSLEISRIVDQTWGPAYPQAVVEELRDLLIGYLYGFKSLCLAETLPGEVLRHYDRFFEEISYTDLAEAPAGEPGYSHTTSLSVDSDGYALTILSDSVFSLHTLWYLTSRKPTQFFDYRRKCAVRLKSEFGEADFRPNHKVLLVRRSKTARFDVFWGVRKHLKGYGSQFRADPGRPRELVGLYDNHDGSDVMILLVHNSVRDDSHRVSVLSTVNDRYIVDEDVKRNAYGWAVLFLLPSRFRIRGDFLMKDGYTYRALAADPVKVFTEPVSPQIGSGLVQHNFRAAISVRRIGTSVHVYEIPELRDKLRRLVTAIDEFWRLPGIDRQALDSSRAALAVVSVARREEFEPVPDWPFELLTVFEDEPDLFSLLKNK